VGIRSRAGHKERGGGHTRSRGAWSSKRQRQFMKEHLEGTETNVKTRKRAWHKEQKYSPKRSRGGHGNICENNHVVPLGQNEAQTAEVIPRNKWKVRHC
jgi:hypothetical protein